MIKHDLIFPLRSLDINLVRGEIFVMIHYLFLFSCQGKVRLQKWFVSYSDQEKKKILREVMTLVLARKPKMSSFLEWKDMKLVYRRQAFRACIFTLFNRYASLYFLCAIEPGDNELLTLETIHRYVEILDKYFGNACLIPWFNDHLGVWVRHHIPLRKGILYTGWVPICGGSSRNECTEYNDFNWRPRPSSRCNYAVCLLIT